MLFYHICTFVHIHAAELQTETTVLRKRERERREFEFLNETRWLFWRCGSVAHSHLNIVFMTGAPLSIQLSLLSQYG